MDEVDDTSIFKTGRPAIDDLRPSYRIRSRAYRLSELSRSDFVLWPFTSARILTADRRIRETAATQTANKLVFDLGLIRE